MGKRLAMRPPPWDKGAAEAEPGSFGHWLRRQRELREISLRDIAERTKISLRYLEAMEDDRFDDLPAPVFAKGFLREYARYVGLSPDEVVNHWLSVQPVEEGDSTAIRLLRGEPPREAGRAGAAKRPAGRSGSWVVRALVLLAVFVALLLVAGAVYYTVQHRGSARRGAARGAAALPAPAPPTAVAPAPPPPAAGAQHAALSAVSPAAPAAVVPPAATMSALPAIETGAPSSGGPSPIEVTLDFTRDCWVEAFVDGKKQVSEERVPGEALQLQAQEKVTLTLGNPSAVEAQVNGYSFDLPHSRQPVRDLVIDLDTLKALKDKREAL